MTIIQNESLPETSRLNGKNMQRKGKYTASYPQDIPASTDFNRVNFSPYDYPVDSYSHCKGPLWLFNQHKKSYNVNLMPLCSDSEGSDSDDSMYDNIPPHLPKQRKHGSSQQHGEIPIQHMGQRQECDYNMPYNDECIELVGLDNQLARMSVNKNTSSLPASSKWIPELNLTVADCEELLDPEMLSDKHMWAAEKLLHKQFPHVCGLQDTCLSQTQFQQVGPGAVQIHHTRGSHWVVSSTLKPDAVIRIYDTLYDSVAPDLKKQLSEMYAELANSDHCIELLMPPVQQQQGFTDCGLYAIAIAYELCLGERNPSDIVFHQDLMRKHLWNCFEDRVLQSFPHEYDGSIYKRLVVRDVIHV